MDIMKKVEQVANELMSDKKLMEKFKAKPVSVIEELLGVDLPDEVVEKIIDGVKAKIDLDKIGDALGALGGLFGKK